MFRVYGAPYQLNCSVPSGSGELATNGDKRDVVKIPIEFRPACTIHATLLGQRASEATVIRKLAALRAVFGFLVEHQLVGVNPAAALRGPPRRRRLPRALPAGHAERLLEQIDGSEPLQLRDRAMLELAYSSGLRVSELTGLDVGELDLVDAEVRVIGKGTKTRIVPVGEHALGALDAYVQHGRPVLIATYPSERALFVSKNGKRLSASDVRRRLRAWAERAALMSVAPHALRHAFATHCSRAAPTSARSRRCSGMNASRRRRSTHTSRPAG
jgi:integrase/recombinase XerC/integrase/recombinase XerD